MVSKQRKLYIGLEKHLSPILSEIYLGLILAGNALIVLGLQENSGTLFDTDGLRPEIVPYWTDTKSHVQPPTTWNTNYSQSNTEETLYWAIWQ